MRRLAALAAIASALVAVPSSGADGGLTWHLVSGTVGDNGWYRSSVVIDIQSSGTGTCPSSARLTFAASSDIFKCNDGSVAYTLQFNIDTTAPTVTSATPARAADENGWYDHPVAVTFAGSDAGSGIASCSSTTYSGPDSSSAAATGTCTDVAGNVSAPYAFSLKYDGTGPSVTASPARPPDGNGWYTHPVTVTFGGTDGASGIASCSAAVTYSGPDTGGTNVSGSCSDNAGNSATGSLAVRYDATAPTVAAHLSRPPDSNGWYTHPVTVTFTGTDGGSGIGACTAPVTYAGPAGDAKVPGTCHDAAGNAATATAAFRYDSTPPKLDDVSVVPGAESATLRWHAPSDTVAVEVTRAPGRRGTGDTKVYDGRAPEFHDTGLAVGVAYRYTLDSRDRAGNRWRTTLTVRLRPLFAPLPGARVHAGARLGWVAAPKASYYNVQLFRGSRKVLSVWPLGTSYALPRSLPRGRYRWYVWPGYGARPQAKYGRLLGSSTFRLT